MSQRTSVAAVLSINGHEAEILEGLTTVALEHRWATGIYDPHILSTVFREIDPALWFFSSSETAGEVAKQARGLRISIGVDRSSQGIYSIMPDDQAVGQEAARHLLERGFRNFSAFAHFGSAFAEIRIRSFRETIEQAGGTYFGGGDAFGEQPSASGAANRANIARWLGALPRPIGIFAPADTWAGHLGRVVWYMSLQVPDDIAIIGAGNEEIFCNLSYPHISSVAIRWRQIGRDAGLIGAQMLRGERLRPRCMRILPCGVVTRQSTDITLVPDTDVSLAVRHIRHNSNTIRGVDDILKHVACNRRTLERAFRKHLGRSILEEIRRARVAHAQQLLATTDFALPRITELCGFSSLHRLHAAFRDELSSTPASYRRRFRDSESASTPTSIL